MPAGLSQSLWLCEAWWVQWGADCRRVAQVGLLQSRWWGGMGVECGSPQARELGLASADGGLFLQLVEDLLSKQAFSGSLCAATPLL